MDYKLEVVVVPFSDVGRAKEFYGRLGRRLDADVAEGWPNWCAACTVAERAGAQLPT